MKINHIYQGDCIKSMRLLPDESIDCCITSPPYWGLRDYGHADQIGLEETPEAYVGKIVDIFREIRRILKPTGTVWLNLGDSYAGNCSRASYGRVGLGERERDGVYKRTGAGLKSKDLVGIPWMVAFALRSDGWYLRQDIIWHKPNPMPESVNDRCTKAHEYIFLLSKSAKYYYDEKSIREPAKDWGTRNRSNMRNGTQDPKLKHHGLSDCNHSERGRNKRSVWTINTKSYSEAHFATYPEELIRPCILAGCPEGGIVIDPFFGSGTTGVVAVKNNRQWIGCELNSDYINIAEKRIDLVQHNKDMDDSQMAIGDLI